MSSEFAVKIKTTSNAPGGTGSMLLSGGAGGNRLSQGLHYTKGETHLQLTQPLWEQLTPTHLKLIRIAIAVANTISGIFDASYTGWSPYLWYFVDWCLLLTLATQWGMVIVHFFPFHPGLSKGVNFLFQVTLPMTVAITIIYWLFFYHTGSMHLNSTQTYVHPVFLYLLPALFLIVEWTLNSIMFQYKYVLYMLVIYLCYVPMTYLGKFVLGYYPYYFITWDTIGSYITLIGLGLLQVACFYGFAYCNNVMKKRYMDKLAEKESIMNLDRGIYNEVQMNMFKSTINQEGMRDSNRRYGSGSQRQL